MTYVTAPGCRQNRINNVLTGRRYLLFDVRAIPRPSRVLSHESPSGNMRLLRMLKSHFTFPAADGFFA